MKHQQEQNYFNILVKGEAASGKTTSAYDLMAREDTLYLAGDISKDVSAPNLKCKVIKLTNIETFYAVFAELMQNEHSFNYIILDTITHFMETAEAEIAQQMEDENNPDGFERWNRYSTLLHNLYKIYVPNINSHFITYAHSVYETEGSKILERTTLKTKVGKNIEADFSDILYACAIPLKQALSIPKELLKYTQTMRAEYPEIYEGEPEPTIDDYKTDLLKITPDEAALKIKRVFVTRSGGEYLVQKIRSIVGTWESHEMFIDNSILKVIDRLNEKNN